MTGIYKILNMVNNKIYIGQSVNIRRRWNNHKSNAFNTTCKSYNSHLYRAIRKYGLENFSFEVIEECPKDRLNEREKYYIEFFNSNDPDHGYNETNGYDQPQYGFQGESHPRHKLTADEVYYIRERYNQHYDEKEVYKEFSDRLSKSGFKKIWLGYNWFNVHMDVYTEENNQYYLFQRNSHPGAKNGRAKLTDEAVYDIRLRKKRGETWKEVYEDYSYTGITEGSFKQIWRYQNWKHIKV